MSREVRRIAARHRKRQRVCPPARRPSRRAASHRASSARGWRGCADRLRLKRSRWPRRCDSTCCSVSATNPRLARSPEGARQGADGEGARRTTGDSRGWCGRSIPAGAARTRRDDRFPRRRPGAWRLDTPASRAVSACPWYRAWAATSPAWLTRIRRTDSARSASAPRFVPGGGGRNVASGRAGAVKTLIVLSISPIRRSTRLEPASIHRHIIL